MKETKRRRVFLSTTTKFDKFVEFPVSLAIEACFLCSVVVNEKVVVVAVVRYLHALRPSSMTIPTAYVVC